MSFQIQPVNDLEEIKTLLQSCRLPVDDLEPGPRLKFFGIHDGNTLQAVIGLETCASVALLRSLAVVPVLRSQGIGRALVSFAEQFASRHGIERLYLLTTSASGFFSSLGYIPLDRAAAPPAVRDTAQFSGLCPASSTFMFKLLA